MALMGHFEDINGKFRGHGWEISRTVMGNFEAIYGNTDDIYGKFR